MDLCKLAEFPNVAALATKLIFSIDPYDYKTLKKQYTSYGNKVSHLATGLAAKLAIGYGRVDNCMEFIHHTLL